MSKAEILKGKMPVTLLQEMCAKNKSSLPLYQYIDEEISLHAPNVKIFTYKVSALGKQANGVGRSKQEAKHEAAWQLIRLALDLPACADDEIVAALGVDRVCQVRDICIQRNFPLPEIELVRNYGPSHAPVFEYECRIQEIVRRGVHATKKGAKQIACQEMIKTLQSMPVEEESLQLLPLDMAIEEADDTNENIIKTYREYTTSDIKKKLGVSIADRHTFFLELPQERIDEARRLLMDPNESEREKCFRIATTLGLKSKILTSNPNLPTIKGNHMSTFELLNPDFDCLIIGEGEAFYTKVVGEHNLDGGRKDSFSLIDVDMTDGTTDEKSSDYKPSEKIPRLK
ncbi:uncharacterized protein LOC128716335 [Anopheles marshallii]|uniref:uncharacterized protein LOC128716335 n=1 Tax=Anopheles marshallii TaxID=1521116 RepID=UPI00237BD6B9|nr:uncharacterized protein LOC128716335 [Anopheles marshallii]